MDYGHQEACDTSRLDGEQRIKRREMGQGKVNDIAWRTEGGLGVS